MQAPAIFLRFWLRGLWQTWVQRPAYVPSQPLFLIHLPKTAGTSFRNMLFRLVDPQVTYPNFFDLGKYRGDYPSLEQLQALLPCLQREVRLLSGHYPFAAGDLLPAAPRYAVFLREPVARTISNLVHFKRNLPDCRRLSLTEIFHRHQLHLQNLQTRFLAATSLSELQAFYQPDLLTEKSLHQAKANLEKCTFVGITEQFSTSINIAEALFGVKFGRPLRSNVSPLNIQVPDSELTGLLLPYLRLDLELYHFALELFENRKSITLKPL